jgi:hypothetical protein
MDGMPVLTSVVAKALTLVGVVGDNWATVSSHVGGVGGNIVEVTPLQCGREMYYDVSWMLCAAVHWALPQLVDVMRGLSLAWV